MIKAITEKKDRTKRTVVVDLFLILLSLIPIKLFELSGINEKYTVFFVLLAPIYVYVFGKLLYNVILFFRITFFLKSVENKIPADLTTEEFYEACDFIYHPYQVYIYNELLLFLGNEYKLVDLNHIDTLEFSISSPKYKSNYEWFINIRASNGKISSYRLNNSLDAPTIKIKNNLEFPLRGYLSRKFPDIKVLETI